MALVRVTKDTITPFIKKFPEMSNTMIGNGLFRITKEAQKQLRASITRGGEDGGKPLKDTGNLWLRTQARKLSKNRSVVFIPGYGVALDMMRTHWVSLKRGRSITRWAMKAPNSPWAGSKPRELPRAIEVHAHPWIDRPLEVTFKRSEQIMQQEIDKIK